MADQEMKFRATLDGDTLSPALDRIRASFEATVLATSALEQTFAGSTAGAQALTTVLNSEGGELTREEIQIQKLNIAMADLARLHEEGRTRVLGEAEATGQATTQLTGLGGAAQQTATHLGSLHDAASGSMDRLKSGAAEASPAVEGIRGVVGALVAQLPSLSDVAHSAGDGAKAAFAAVEASAKAMWGAVTGGLSILADVGKALLGNAEQTKQWQDTMDDTSAVLGISRQSMIDWNYAAQQTPLTTEQFTGAMTHLTTQMRATDVGYDKQKEQVTALQAKLTELNTHIAETGDKHGTLHAQQVKLENQITALTEKIPRQAKAFADLGIQIYDAQGQFRSIDSMLPQLADKFQAMPDGPEKTALAMKLFGSSGIELLEFLNKGSAGLEAYRQHAEALGITITDKDITANNLLIESQQALHQAWDGITHKVGQVVIPLLADLATKAVPLIEGALTWAGHLKDDLAPGLSLVGDVVGRLLAAVSPLSDALGLLLAGDWSGFGQKVGAALQSVLNVIGDTIGSLVQGAAGWGQGLVAQFSNGIIAGIGSFLAPALDTIGGFITGLLEPHSPPPLLPHLDKWGADAASIYLHGWTQGDYSAFDSMAGAIKDHLTTLLDTGTIGKLDLDPMLGSARDALQAAQTDFVRFGEVSSGAIDRLSRTLGPGREALLAYIETTFQLETAHRQTADAAAHLTSVQERYKAQLDSVSAKVRQLAADEKAALGSLPDQIQAVQDRLTQMGRDSEAAIHPLDLQLHALDGQLKAVQAAGASALQPFTDELRRTQDVLRAVQEQSSRELDPLKENIRQAQDALRDLQEAGQAALAPFDDQLKSANADLAALRDQAQATMQGFADQTQPLQDALSALGAQSAAALAPIDAALAAAKARVDEFKLASTEIATKYDAQLAPLLAQLHAVQDIELKKKHSEELHDMGLAVENLAARLKNAVPGSAEYIEIQKELAKAQGDLADKTAEYSADDKVKELQKEKEEALAAAKQKEDAAALDVTALEKQRAAVVATSEAQRKAIEGQLQDIAREQQAFQRAEQQREQGVQHHIQEIAAERQTVADKYQAEITASQRAIEQQQREEQARDRYWQAQAQQAQATVQAAQDQVSAEQAHTAGLVAAIQAQITPIQAKRDALQYAAQESQRAAQIELQTLQGEEQAITRRYSTERAALQDTQAAIQEKQRTETDAATASLKAATDTETALKATADAEHSLLTEQKNAAEVLKEYDAALTAQEKKVKAAHGATQAWKPDLTGLKDGLGDTTGGAKGLTGALSTLGTTLGTAWTNAKGAFDSFLSGIRTGFDDFKKLIDERGVVGAIATEIKRGWDVLTTWAGDAGPKLMTAIGQIFDAIGTYLEHTAFPDLAKSAEFLSKALVDWAEDAAPKVGHALESWGKAIGDYVTGTAVPAVQKAAGDLAQGAVHWAEDAAQNIGSKLGEWGQSISTGVTTAVTQFGHDTEALAEKGWHWVVDSATALPGKLADWAHTTADYIANTALPNFAHDMGLMAGHAVRWIVDAAQALPGEITNWWHVTTSEIHDKIELFKSQIEALAHHAVAWITTAATELPGRIEAWWHATTSAIHDKIELFKNQIAVLAQHAVSWVTDAATAIPQKLQEFWNSITGWFTSTGKPGIQTQGKGLVDGLFDGLEHLIIDGPAKIGKWVSGLVDNLLSGFREGFGVKSPSTKMMEIAGHLISGLVEGLDPAKLLAKIQDVAGSALDSFKNILGIHSPSKETTDMGAYLLQGLTGGMDSGNAQLTTSFDRITTVFTGWKTTMLAATTTALQALPPLWQVGLAALNPIWDSLFGSDAGQQGTLLNRLWGHQADSFFSVLVAYTKTKNAQWFDVTWTAALDELATKLTAYLRLKAGEISVGGGEIGHQIIMGIAAQITADTHFVEEAAAAAVHAAIEAGKKAGEIHSPSERAAQEIGKPLAQGTAKGITDHAGDAQAAMRAVVGGAVGVGVPTGGGVPMGVPTGGGALVGVPMGAGAGQAGGAGAPPTLNVTFNVTVTGDGSGELRGPKGERGTDPLFWAPYIRALRMAWEREYRLTPEGRAL